MAYSAGYERRGGRRTGIQLPRHSADGAMARHSLPLTLLFCRLFLEIKNPLAVRAEMDLSVLLDFVVELRRQQPAASHAAPALRQRHCDSLPSGEKGVVALEQIGLNLRGGLVPLAAFLGDRGLQLLDL